MTTEYGSSERIAALDGLRGLACLMVFGVHFGQFTRLDGSIGPFQLGRLLANGNTGVALFFVLSGMLLSLPFWQSKLENSQEPGLGTYFANRCIRILPAYYACLTVLIIANRHWERSDGWNEIGLHYTLAFNYFEWSIFSINPPFWTIAVEAQFYLLLPVLFVLTRRMGGTGTALSVLILAVASYVLHAWLIGASETTARTGTASPILVYSLIGHLPHFLLGVLAGRAYLRLAHSGRNLHGVAEALAWITLAAIVIVLGTPIDDWLAIPHGHYNLPYVPALIAALLVLVPFAPIMSRTLDGFPLRYIGLLSYGIYIYHLPVQHLVIRLLGRMSIGVQEHWLLFGILSLALSIAVAAGSYVTIERPLMRALRRVQQKRRRSIIERVRSSRA